MSSMRSPVAAAATKARVSAWPTKRPGRIWLRVAPETRRAIRATLARESTSQALSR